MLWNKNMAIGSVMTENVFMAASASCPYLYPTMPYIINGHRNPFPPIYLIAKRYTFSLNILFYFYLTLKSSTKTTVSYQLSLSLYPCALSPSTSPLAIFPLLFKVNTFYSRYK
ncbi:hypothetical protein BX070DRAFT_51253 [Coemansia spiralis]|nr:hypothetical protein BX070DRAFT_51253 [Coemansia spiralis]